MKWSRPAAASAQRGGLWVVCDMRRAAHTKHKCNLPVVQAGDARRGVLGAEAHELLLIHTAEFLNAAFCELADPGKPARVTHS